MNNELNNGNTGLVKVEPTHVPTMSSRDIAGLTCKEHKNVKRDIEKMFIDLDLDALNFERIYLDGLNRQQTEYFLPRRECEILVTGYDVSRRAAVIDRWIMLETRSKPASPAELSRMEILQLAMDSERGRIEEKQLRIKAEESRKKAVREKGQISNSREARAMSALGKLTKQNRELKAELAHAKNNHGRAGGDLPMIGYYEKPEHYLSRKMIFQLVWDKYGLPKSVVGNLLDNRITPVAKVMPPIENEHAYYLAYDEDEVSKLIKSFIRECKKISNCRAIHIDYEVDFSLRVNPEDV